MSPKSRMKLGEYLIYKGIESGGKALGEAVRKATDEEVRAAIDRLQVLVDILDKAGSDVKYDRLKQQLWSTSHDMRSLLQQAKEAETKGEIDTLVNAFAGIFNVLRPFLTFAWEIMYDTLMRLIGPEENMTYEKAHEKIINFMTINGDLNILSAALYMIGDIEIFGCKLPGKGLAKMIETISWTFGLGWLTWVAVGPSLQTAMADPLNRYYKRLTRTGSPTRADWEDMWRKKLIDDNELLEVYRDQGYPEDVLDKLLKSNRKYPSESALKTLYARGKLNEDDVKRWLEKVGYRDETLDVAWDSFVADEEKNWFNKYIDELIKDYVEGYINDADLRNDLAYQGIPSHVIDWIIYVAKRRADRELKDNYVKAEVTNFREKKISIDELQSRLTSWIKRAEVIQAIIDYEQSRLKPEEEPYLTAKKDEKLRKLQFRKEAIISRINYLAKVRQDTADYYSYKIRQLEIKLTKATEEEKQTIQLQIQQLQSQQDKALAQIDSQIQQLQIKLSEVNSDIEALGGAS